MPSEVEFMEAGGRCCLDPKCKETWRESLSMSSVCINLHVFNSNGFSPKCSQRKYLLGSGSAPAAGEKQCHPVKVSMMLKSSSTLALLPQALLAHIQKKSKGGGVGRMVLLSTGWDLMHESIKGTFHHSKKKKKKKTRKDCEPYAWLKKERQVNFI